MKDPGEEPEEGRDAGRGRSASPGADRGTARETILARVRAALAERAAAEHPGDLSVAAPETDAVEAFTARFEASGGEVVSLAGRNEARRWLEAFGREFGSAAVGRDLPGPLRPDLPDAPPPEADLGVSMARWAAADTGSLLLDSREGRRAQLLPPTHLVWVPRERVVPTLAGALERAREEGLPPTLALHSGPSKSADIGQILVTGIHGPGRVVAGILTGSRAPGARPAQR